MFARNKITGFTRKQYLFARKQYIGCTVAGKGHAKNYFRKWKVGKTEVKSRENGSEKSGKRKWKVEKMKKKQKKSFVSWKKAGKWKVEKMNKIFVCFLFVFPTFHFRFPDFSLPFSRLFTSVFPTFHFRFPDFCWILLNFVKKKNFPDFSLPEVKSRENGSEKSGKWKKKKKNPAQPSHRMVARKQISFACKSYYFIAGKQKPLTTLNHGILKLEPTVMWHRDEPAPRTGLEPPPPPHQGR